MLTLQAIISRYLIHHVLMFLVSNAVGAVGMEQMVSGAIACKCMQGCTSSTLVKDELVFLSSMVSESSYQPIQRVSKRVMLEH